MGILLGLATALGWVFPVFARRSATRRIGTLLTMFYMQACGFLLLTAFLLYVRASGHLFDGSGWRPWAWGALAGSLNALSTLSLYRSFEVGKLAVVAPISASYPALTLLLSLATGEGLTPARAIGIVLTLMGVIFVAAGEVPKADADAASVSARGNASNAGIPWALLSSLGFGVLFWLLGTR